MQFVWRAVLFLGQKGRLWVLFRLLVVGVRIRILIPIRWKKRFYKHLSLPFCPNFFFYYQIGSISKKHQLNAFGSRIRLDSSQSLLRCILLMTLTPATARVLVLARNPSQILILALALAHRPRAVRLLGICPMQDKNPWQ